MIEEASGIILAGGASRRFGSPKALVPWKESRLIDETVRIVTALFPMTYVLVKKSGELVFSNRENPRVVEDCVADTHPLGGIFSGLNYAETEWIFVSPCDTPFLRPTLIEALWQVRSGFDAVVPVWEGRPQPLCGFYSQRCKALIKSRIDEHKLAVHEIYELVSTRFLKEEDVRAVDPEGLSFRDIDTPDDYEEVGKLVSGEREMS